MVEEIISYNVTEDEFLSWVPRNYSNTDDPIINLGRFMISQAMIQYILVNLYGFLIQVFFLPYIGLLLLYLLSDVVSSAIVCYHFKYQSTWKNDNLEKLYETLQSWNAGVMRAWFGHSLVGVENIPVDEPVMFIFYHGTISVDLFSLSLFLRKYRQKPVYTVIDRILYSKTVFKKLYETLNIGSWTKEDCVEFLRQGNDVMISPGGIIEVRHCSEKYELHWGNRTAFAKIIHETKVPVIPVFCRNIQEAFWMPFYARPYFWSRFAPKNQFINLVGGGLPVKLTTLIGKPIRFEQNASVDDIVEKVKLGLQRLIEANQRIPGAKFQAIRDRCRKITYETNIDYDEIPEVKVKDVVTVEEI